MIIGSKVNLFGIMLLQLTHSLKRASYEESDGEIKEQIHKFLSPGTLSLDGWKWKRK